MYFITNKSDISIWTNDLLEIIKINKQNANMLSYETKYDNLELINKEYLDFLGSGNPIEPNNLKVGDIFELYGWKNKNSRYLLLRLDYHEQDKYYMHIVKDLDTEEENINLGLFWTKYVNLIKRNGAEI